jgi:hypothetical protein
VTALHVDETDLKQGVLGLVIAVVEVVQDTLKIQAVKVMESGILDDSQCERLGKALMELENALEDIKREQGIAGAVRSVRDGLDGIVDDLFKQAFTEGVK